MISRFSALIEPFSKADGPPPDKVWPFLRWALKGAWPGIFVAVVITFLTGLSELVAARFTGWVIDSAAEIGPGAFWGPFWPIITFGLVFFLILRPILFAMDASVTSVLLGPQLFPLVLSRVNKFVLGHSLQFFENDFAGRISQKSFQVSRAVVALVLEMSDVVVFAGAIFVGALVVLGSVDPRLLTVFVLWSVLYVATIRYFVPRIRSLSEKVAGARSNLNGQVVDAISNVTTVKLFARDQDEDDAARKSMDDLRHRAIRYGTTSAWFRMALMTLGGMLPVASILGVLALWTAGEASSGDIAMTAMVTTRMSMVTNRLGRVVMSVFSDIGEIEDGIATLCKPHGLADRVDAGQSLQPGAIWFDNVSFGYGKEGAALQAFDLKVKQGEKVAFVGASGAGKSTAMSLLMRLYDVEDGRILIGGTDIRDVTQSALRRQISVVRQETSMFNRSALENIRYGKPDASQDDVIQAAKQAAAHEFITGLRDNTGRTGYDARLGERGVKLSGGQRQRIALARAILKNAPILILDEATSALDSEVEAEIQTALNTVMRGKTVLAIAHRLSTIAQMDRIVVLDEGRIVEQGSHEDLLARNGLYARYWTRQSGGFIGADVHLAEKG